MTQSPIRQHLTQSPIRQNMTQSPISSNPLQNLTTNPLLTPSVSPFAIPSLPQSPILTTCYINQTQNQLSNGFITPQQKFKTFPNSNSVPMVNSTPNSLPSISTLGSNMTNHNPSPSSKSSSSSSPTQNYLANGNQIILSWAFS